jgi:hypothetical protein
MKAATILKGVSILLSLALPPSLWAGTVNLPQTGQTKCYDSSGNEIACQDTGQDGDWQAGVSWPSPRFTDNGDGTVTDNLTGLMWLQDANCINTQYPNFDNDGTVGDGKVTWQHALDFVAGINSGAYPNCGAGYTDWRLPNIIELESLINAGEIDVSAWLNTQGFINVAGDDDYWSSTSSASYNNRAWRVGFDYSNLVAHHKLSEGYLLPVRGTTSGPARLWQTGQTKCYDESGVEISCAGTGQDGEYQAGVAWPSPRFTDNGDGTVTDNLTGLIWLKDANCFRGKAWDGALAAANNLSEGQCGLSDGSSAGDWRLPNRKELFSLIGYTQGNPVLPPGHPFNNVSGGYASSTPYGGYLYRVVYIGTDGHICGNFFDMGANVWPVRVAFVGPIPDIKANGSDGPVTLNHGDPLSVTIALNCGDSADWWVVVNTPLGWYRYDPSTDSWKPGLSCSYQGSLVNIGPIEVLNTTAGPQMPVVNTPDLPTGTYNFYFGVDLNMNCSLDMGQMYYDSVEVNIVP